MNSRSTWNGPTLVQRRSSGVVRYSNSKSAFGGIACRRSSCFFCAYRGSPQRRPRTSYSPACRPIQRRISSRWWISYRCGSTRGGPKNHARGVSSSMERTGAQRGTNQRHGNRLICAIDRRWWRSLIGAEVKPCREKSIEPW